MDCRILTCWRPQQRRSAATALLAAAIALAAAPATHAAVPPEQVELVERVMQRLLAVVDKPEDYDVWPPQWRVIDEDQTNAFAWIDKDQLPKTVPIVRVYRGLIEEIAEGNEDRLAFILGHELAHLTCGHVLADAGETEVLYAAFTREQELEADAVGMKIVMEAGYSYREAMGAPQQFRDSGHAYTSFEGVGTDHPSWTDRLAALESDEQQAVYWRAMSAYETGVFLLRSQNYFHAQACFRRVTDEFPQCYEAWVNLGFAQLMEYCEALESDDLEAFGVGQLIVGGFYTGPPGTRSPFNEDLWWDAVGSFQRALTINSDSLLAKANLALAYLVHPSGTPDLGQASRLYADVATLLDDPDATANVDPLTRASLLANAWIGIYHNDSERDALVMQQINNYLVAAERNAQLRPSVGRVRAALGYTQASALASSTAADEQRQAFDMFENYLANTPSDSSWWTLAYKQYAQLARKLSIDAKSEETLSKPKTDNWRIVSAVKTSSGTLVAVADRLKLATAALDDSVEGTLIDPKVKLGLKQFDYPQIGLSLVGGREVTAIILYGPNAPAVELRRAALGAKPQQLAIGMPRAEVEALLGDAWSSTNTSIIDPRQRHEFYEQVGVAVQYGADNTVSEIIVTVAPDDGAGK